MREVTNYPNARRSLKAGSDAAMVLGSMSMPPGTRTYGIGMRVELNVKATADTAALTVSQTVDVLKALKFSAQVCHSLTNAVKPWQNQRLNDVRDDCRLLLRRDFEDVESTTTGLRKTLTTGDHVLTFTAFVPLAYAAHILEARKVMGLGHVQMLDSTCSLGVEGDPFKTVAAALSLQESYVTFFPLWDVGHRHFIGHPVMVTKQVAPEKEGLETKPGLVLSAHQMVPYTTTALDKLTVEVGGVPVSRDVLPDAIQAAYERSKGLADVELDIDASRTLIYGPNGDTEFASLIAGKLVATQDVLEEAWNLRLCMLDYLTTQHVYELCVLEASSLDPGVQLLVTNAAPYDSVDANPAQLAFSGFVGFPSTEAAFYENAGIRVAPDENGVLTAEPYIPPHMARQYARRIIDAMKPSKDHPKGDGGAVEGIFEEATWRVPGFIVDPRGTKYVSTVAAKVKEIIRGYVAEEEQRQREGQRLMGKLSQLAGEEMTRPAPRAPQAGRARQRMP